MGGAFVSSRLDEARWRRETTLALQREMFAKRSELMERTIRVFNGMQTLDVVNASADVAAAEGEEHIRAGRSAQATAAALSEAVFRAKAVQADLSVVMTMNVIYFGPKTKKAVVSLQASLRQANPWWKVDEAKTQAVLDALGAELYLNLTPDFQ
jgi:hypothetical protein